MSPVWLALLRAIAPLFYTRPAHCIVALSTEALLAACADVRPRARRADRPDSRQCDGGRALQQRGAATRRVCAVFTHASTGTSGDEVRIAKLWLPPDRPANVAPYRMATLVAVSRASGTLHTNHDSSHLCAASCARPTLAAENCQPSAVIDCRKASLRPSTTRCLAAPLLRCLMVKPAWRELCGRFRKMGVPAAMIDAALRIWRGGTTPLAR